jgi:hypothetical protein
MVKLVDPGEFLIQLNFQELMPAGQKSKKIGSKAYILSHGIFNDGFTLKELKGDIEGAEINPEEVRHKLGVYSETELENLKKDFLDKELLEQKRTRGPYYLTDLGFQVLETYVNLIRLNKLAKKFEYLRTQNQLYLMKNLGKLPITSGDIESMQDDLSEWTETQKRWEDFDIGAGQDSVDDREKPKKLMTEFFRGIIEEEKETLERLEKEIQKGVDMIQDNVEDLDSNGCHDEAEEIEAMVERITQYVEFKDLNSLEKEEEQNALDKYSSDQDWSLDLQQSL